MLSTTPRGRARLLVEFPELSDYALAAARLHPRPGVVAARDSSVGGPMLWPIDEPWPTCSQPHLRGIQVEVSDDRARRRLEETLAEHRRQLERLKQQGADEGRLAPYRERIAEEEAIVGRPLTRRMLAAQSTEPVVMAAVVQLFARDVPGLAFPPNRDLLQILWCPEEHEYRGGPLAVASWRRAAEVTQPRTSNPTVTGMPSPRSIPRPCVVHPEVLFEYPPICNLITDDVPPPLLGLLPPDLEDRLRRWNRQQPEGQGFSELAHAPGWKIGGWDRSEPDPQRGCDQCGSAMRPILTVDGNEWLGGLWQPQDDPMFAWGDPASWRDADPTGVWIGRGGFAQFRLCVTDPGHALQSWVL